MKKFYDIYTKNDIQNTMKNKYFLSFKYKITDKIYISNKYGIVIRNANKIEVDILSQSLIDKICQIFLLFDNVDDIFNESKIENVKSIYLKRFTDFNDKTIISYDLDGFDYSNNFDKIINIIKNNIEKTDIKNIELLAQNISNKYLKNLVVLYSEKEEKIYNIIHDCINYNNDDIDDLGKYDDFINKYIELWNSINFKQYNYFGIKVNIFSTKLNEIIGLMELEKMEMFDECISVFNSPVQIDITNDKLFYFIINRFTSCYYMDDNNRILLYFSLLELLLTRKPICNRDGIVRQLCNNIMKVKNKYGEIIICEGEIKDLYNYRSLLVHGNLNKCHKSLCKIKKYDFAKQLIKMLDIEEFVDDDLYIIDLIRIRTLEIFSYVYKIYCSDEKFIDKIKSENMSNNIFRNINLFFNVRKDK